MNIKHCIIHQILRCIQCIKQFTPILVYPCDFGVCRQQHIPGGGKAEVCASPKPLDNLNCVAPDKQVRFLNPHWVPQNPSRGVGTPLGFLKSPWVLEPPFVVTVTHLGPGPTGVG